MDSSNAGQWNGYFLSMEIGVGVILRVEVAMEAK